MEQITMLAEQLRQKLPKLELRQNEPLCNHTSFQIGGPVSLLALPKSEEEAAVTLRTANALGVEPFFLGKGSNLLASDAPIQQFLMKSVGGLQTLDIMDSEEETSIYVESGITLQKAAEYAQRYGLTGLEFAHGIPGSLGGGVMMNAGAYGGEMSSVVEWVDCLTFEGRRERVPRKSLDFGYRHSCFSDGKRLILGACLKLEAGDRAEIQQKMDELLAQRQSKQPLEYPSAGSIFKRPPGYFAGTLIDQCGLKGFRIGGAQVSTKHAGFIVNVGGATCEDVRRLIAHIQETVLREAGVTLEPEVRTLGFHFS